MRSTIIFARAGAKSDAHVSRNRGRINRNLEQYTTKTTQRKIHSWLMYNRKRSAKNQLAGRLVAWSYRSTVIQYRADTGCQHRVDIENPASGNGPARGRL